MNIESKTDVKRKAEALLKKAEAKSVIAEVTDEQPKKEKKPREKKEKVVRKDNYSFDEILASFSEHRMYRVFNTNNQKWQWASALKVSDDRKTVHMASRGDTWDVTAERIANGELCIPYDSKSDKKASLWRYEHRTTAQAQKSIKKEKKVDLPKVAEA